MPLPDGTTPHDSGATSSDVFDSCPTGTFHYSVATDELHWSEEVYRIHGYERGEVVPSHELGLTHVISELRDRARAFWDTLLTDGGPLSAYLTLLDGKGRHRQILVTADITRESGVLVAVEGLVIDLTRTIHSDSHRLANEAVAAAGKRRGAIEQAKGILMGHTGISAEQAFDVIRQRSQETNRKLTAIAEEIVERAAYGNDQDIQGLYLARKFIRAL